MATGRRFSASARNRRSRTAEGADERPAPRPASLRGAALALLARRDYAVAELKTKLLDRGYLAADVDAVCADLSAAGSLDDRRVAASYVRSALNIKGRGRLRVARELAARGVPRAIVDEALSGVDSQDESAAIRRILTRKKWPARPTLRERRRMFQHLLRRGFSADAIRRELDDAGDES